MIIIKPILDLVTILVFIVTWFCMVVSIFRMIKSLLIIPRTKIHTEIKEGYLKWNPLALVFHPEYLTDEGKNARKVFFHNLVIFFLCVVIMLALSTLNIF